MEKQDFLRNDMSFSVFSEDDLKIRFAAERPRGGGRG